MIAAARNPVRMRENGQSVVLTNLIKGPHTGRILEPILLIHILQPPADFLHFPVILLSVLPVQVIHTDIGSEINHMHLVFRGVNLFPGHDQQIQFYILIAVNGLMGGIFQPMIRNRHKIKSCLTVVCRNDFRRLPAIRAEAVHMQIPHQRNQGIQILLYAVQPQLRFAVSRTVPYHKIVFLFLLKPICKANLFDLCRHIQLPFLPAEIFIGLVHGINADAVCLSLVKVRVPSQRTDRHPGLLSLQDDLGVNVIIMQFCFH